MSEIKKTFQLTFYTFLRQLPFFLMILIACIFVGVFLLTSIFLIFPKITTQHITESAYSFVGKPARESVFDWCFSELDNWTDALILQISADNRDEIAVNRALLAYHGTNESDGGNPATAIVDHYIDGIEYDNPDDTYGRYWHGYILFIRPLLTIMNYSQIRVLNAIIQSLLTLLIFFLLYKKNLKRYIIPYILCILLLNPVIQAMSLQYSPCFYVFSFGMIFAITFSKKQLESFYPYLFLLIGISTSFFDFLTYPISTLGIPLIIYLNRIEKNRFSSLIICVLTWCIGYAGMWIGKWLIANLMTSENVLSNAILGVQTRTSASSLDFKYPIIKTILENLKCFFVNPIVFFSIPFLVFCTFRLFKKRYSAKRKDLYCLIPYFLISLLPILWFAFALNHSAIHSIYTSKSCIVIYFSLLCLISRLSLPCPTDKLGINIYNH